VIEPIAGLDEWRAASRRRDGKVDVVRRLAESHMLLGCCCTRRYLQRSSVGPGGRTFRALLRDGADKAKAAASDRADKSLLLATVADGLPRGGDAAEKRGFRNDSPRPHR
jgi:hypothetical protein